MKMVSEFLISSGIINPNNFHNWRFILTFKQYKKLDQIDNDET